MRACPDTPRYGQTPTISSCVIPAEAGIPCVKAQTLDSRFRGNDEGSFTNFPEAAALCGYAAGALARVATPIVTTLTISRNTSPPRFTASPTSKPVTASEKPCIPAYAGMTAEAIRTHDGARKAQQSPSASAIS